MPAKWQRFRRHYSSLSGDPPLPYHASPDIPGALAKRGSGHTEKDFSMYKKFILALAVLSVFAVAPLLSACHTTAGAGQDISATGKAIEKSAKQNTP